jgi:xanthine/uracil permease
VLPLVAVFSLLPQAHQKSDIELPVALGVSLRGVAFLWAWPSSGNQRYPVSFGLMAIIVLVFLVVLAVRKDWRGVTAIFLWSLFWGWLIAWASGVSD